MKGAMKGARKPKSDLESSLLDMEERAVLLEHEELATGGGGRGGCCRSCMRCCQLVFCDIGSISIMATLAISLLGILLLVLVRALPDIPSQVDELSRYIISAGLFGFATGGTNAIALIMLLYKIPVICGSGVFYRQYGQIKNVIRIIVLQLLFNSEHLQNYISKKIRQFSSHVQVTESIAQALNSPEVAQIISHRLDGILADPDAQLLEAVGLNREQLESMIRPAVLSLCAEAAPYVLDNVQQSQLDKPQAISVPRFRKEMDQYLTWRIEELTQQQFHIKSSSVTVI